MRLVSLDTETTGLDLRHGARPFFVTTYTKKDSNIYWEWDVDPYTRKPIIPAQDREEIREHILSPHTKLVLHNSKFDFTALNSVGIWEGLDLEQIWENTYDTLTASHLLASNLPHDLTYLALQYLGVDIKPLEDKLKTAVLESKSVVKREFPKWKLASKDLEEEMPSAKGTVWKYDTWLPRQAAEALNYPKDHYWHTVLADYANMDSTVTYHLWKLMRENIKNRQLMEIYKARLKCIPVIYHIEKMGVTVSKERLEEKNKEFGDKSKELGEFCVGVAESMDYQLTLPKSKANDSIRNFISEKLKLATPKTPTGKVSLKFELMEPIINSLPPRSAAYHFMKAVQNKGKCDTALSYMSAYKRFGLALDKHIDYFILHPSLNATGTSTLRYSSSNPNEQNISKKKGFNLRYCFGPTPDREWWSLDAKNIELRIPAYEAGEAMMIQLFERPDDPPYYGSNHLLVSHILHPKLFEECVNEQGVIDGRIFKKKYESTWYQWVKNGNFAVQYGAMEESGTADRAYHMKGAQNIVQGRFTEINKLNLRMIHSANKFGYVETIPDKTVDPNRGYPILCKRTQWGKVLATTPLNYHVQGTAMWWMMKAMIRCHELLSSWRNKGFNAYMVMQIHDEIVFDLPRSKVDPREDPTGGKSNLWRIRKLRETMEMSGEDIGIPTPVSCEYHSNNWSEGDELE